MKTLSTVALIIFSLLFTSHFINDEESNTNASYQVIPDDAIRLRILANSDNEHDQRLKRMIRDEVSEEISEWVEFITQIEDARDLIESQTEEIEKIVKNVLKREKTDQEVHVDYGKNITFPHKLYDSYLYPAGEYEAVLITLGEGKGSNWWCVLFPPLCFLDFSGSTSVSNTESMSKDEDVEEEEQPIKVKFFLFEWLGWA